MCEGYCKPNKALKEMFVKILIHPGQLFSIGNWNWSLKSVYFQTAETVACTELDYSKISLCV